ncbi:MAG: MFS transporter [Proteobacteria bacterium]|nr:MFS transporter [Pseudomonadota bacterium]
MNTRSPWAVYAALLFGTFITIEAAAFQAPVLPSITRHYGIPVTLAALILILYFLGLTVLAPIMGRYGDLHGRRRVLTLGLLVFSASEFAAAWAPNFGVFLGARFVQGFGVACILPSVLAYVTHLFPAERRGLALGILTFTMTFGATAGGLLGGLLIDALGWRSVYWISGALALAGLLPVRLLVPEIAASGARTRFDFTGALALFATIAALLSLPTWATNFGARSPLTWVIVAVGVGSLIWLWRHSRGSAAAVIDVDILSHPAFAKPSAIYWLHMLCFSGVVYSLAFFVNNRPGGSASQFGLVTMFLYGWGLVSAPISGRLVDRYEPRTISIVALAGSVAGVLLLLGIDAATPLWLVIVVVSILGLTMGANSPAVMKIAFGAVPAHKMGAGTGMFSMFRDLGNPTGSSLSLAVFGTTLAYQARASVTRQVDALGLDAAAVDALANAAGGRARTLPAEIAQQLSAAGIDAAQIVREASAAGVSAALHNAGYLLAALMTLALLVSLRLPRTAAAPAAGEAARSAAAVR